MKALVMLVAWLYYPKFGCKPCQIGSGREKYPSLSPNEALTSKMDSGMELVPSSKVFWWLLVVFFSIIIECKDHCLVFCSWFSTWVGVLYHHHSIFLTFFVTSFCDKILSDTECRYLDGETVGVKSGSFKFDCSSGPLQDSITHNTLFSWTN